MNIPKQLNPKDPAAKNLVNLDLNDNYIVWLQPRTGSTLFGKIFSQTDFKSYTYKNNNLILTHDDLIHHHAFTIFPEIHSYKLIMTTRNPFSWAVAIFYASNKVDDLSQIQIKFQNFLENNFYENLFISELLYNLHYVEVSYQIRLENLHQDYLGLPIIHKSKYMKQNELHSLINSKVNKSFSPLSKLDYKLFYNKNSADIVYYIFSKYFDVFGYDKNSWK